MIPSLDNANLKMNHKFSRQMIHECRVCNSADMATLYDSARQRVNVWRCKSCRSKIVVNDMDEEELQAVYEGAEQYYTLEGSDHEANLREKAKELATLYGPTPSIKMLLDVGAGTGIFLNAARQAGFDVSGIEFADLPIRIALEKYGIVLTRRTLEEEQATYDVVTAFSVLEHVSRPYEFVHEAVRVLRPGGILALYLPVYGSIDRVAWWLYRLSGKRLTHLLDWRNTRAHLSILTEEALRWLVKAHGLEIVSAKRLCEYNQPIPNYFVHVGIKSGIVLQVCVAFMTWLVRHDSFFHNNIMLYARKPMND